MSYKWGVSFTAFVTAWDISANDYKTGDAANISTFWNKDGTNGATTNAVAEVSAGNSPGLYKITMTAAEAQCLVGRLSGKSSTTNVRIFGEAFPFEPSFVSDVGVAVSFSANTLQLRAAAPYGATNDPTGQTVYVIDGTNGKYQSRQILSYDFATQTVTVDPWNTALTGTPTYAIMATSPGSTVSPPVVVLAGAAGLKKNTALANFEFKMFDSTTHAEKAGLGAGVTATRSIDGAAYGACANAVAEVANGTYKINLAAADLNGATVSLRFTAAGADATNYTFVMGL